MKTLLPPENILASYGVTSAKATISILGEGNINDTFLVQTEKQAIVLQRINEQVFPDPKILIHNLRHLSASLQAKPDSSKERWQETLLIPTVDGSLSVRDCKGSLWRAISYIKNSYTISHVNTHFQAEETGWALGHFHTRLADLDVHEMKIPLPGFHHTSNYLKQYDTIMGNTSIRPTADINFCVNSIRKEREKILVLEKALAQGTIQQTVTHGDPKIGNVLFDKSTNRAISLIDLDTIGPGLLVHDIGDCLRSVCNITGENSSPKQVLFNIDFCRSTLKGYFREANTQLTTMDREFIYDGIKVITFELGLRFFIDFLLGGIYFKCSTPEATLLKATVQFSLLQSIICQEQAIRILCKPA